MKPQRRILVVEDEPHLSMAIRTKLELSGFQASFVANTADAWHRLTSAPAFDAVWVDHYLAIDDFGYDLVIRIKADSRFSRLPIFLVSVTATDAIVKKYLQAGVVKHYPKLESSMEDIIVDIKAHLEA